MATTSKITKRDQYTALVTYLRDTGEDIGSISNATALAFYEHELELLDKKNSSGSAKPTAKQVENEGLKDAILNYMEEGVRYTVSDLLNSVPELSGLNASKVNALVKQMKDAKVITRIEKKRQALFIKGNYTLAEDEREGA